ncbi:hypothetical protein [Lysobacter sp. CA199]|uniref:hypothetical protein n=1 Tax=Lysobacter sp. CA199 TaxID=3455608 RepID=UPI003F8D248E
MWRTLVFIGVLVGSSAYAQEARSEKIEPSPESRRAEAQARERDRIEALARRGLQGNYQALLKAGKVSANVRGASIALNAEQVEAISRVSAIDLAALGFTASDVAAYRRRNVNLFDVVDEVFTGLTSSPFEQMMLTDTVVIATAGKVEESRARTDGYLSAIPYTVVKSLKGSRAVGDLIHHPRQSGPQSAEIYVDVSSDYPVTPGKKYLLTASRNWYEQRVAENKKQAESGFNALAFIVYEISDDGTLLSGPRPTLSGEAPKDLPSIEADLRNLPVK